MERVVGDRSKYYYGFFEYNWTRFLHNFCCCFLDKESKEYKRRQFRHDRYKRAKKRLRGEIDILKHVQGQRMTDFLAHLNLRDYQRVLVSSFKEYQLGDMTQADDRKRQQSKFIDSLKRTSILDLLDDESHWKRTNKDIEEDEMLTPAQKKLLKKIRT